MATTPLSLGNSREQLVHALYEAAELEHNLMCTYLYAAFSLKRGEGEGLNAAEASAVERWRSSIIQVAVGGMGHLAAVWNITAALGAAPRIGRVNFPLDPGYLPAGIIVKLAPFNAQTLQHFIFLERPHASGEAEGEGFVPERMFVRGNPGARLTPMSMDYDTVGAFYESLKDGLAALVDRVGEERAFRGNPALQLAGIDFGFAEAKPVKCLKTALAAFDSIVLQGEGSPAHADDSHFQKFLAIRAKYAALRATNPTLSPAYPAATNPVLRRPPSPEGRVWIEGDEAVSTVDLANAGYGLMLRLLAYAYAVPAQAAKGGSRGFEDWIDAFHRTARRARGPPTGRPLTSGVSCRHVVYDIAGFCVAASRTRRRGVLCGAPARIVRRLGLRLQHTEPPDSRAPRSSWRRSRGAASPAFRP